MGVRRGPVRRRPRAVCVASAARLALLWACVGAIAPVLGACKDKAPALTISRIVLDAPREYDTNADARTALRHVLEQRMEGEGSARLIGNERDASHVLYVRIGELIALPRAALQDVDARIGESAGSYVGEVKGGKGDAEAAEAAEHSAQGTGENSVLMRAVQVRLRPLRGGSAYEAVGTAEGADRVAAALESFEDAWRAIMRQRVLDTQPDGALIEVLDDGDMRIRDFAITRLGDRKSKAAVDPLCRRLGTEPKSDLVLRIVGSLVAIGDAYAVDPIIALSKKKDPDFVIQVIYAVGSIGGRNAEAFLVTMASGHPVESVRRSAEQALLELHKRAALRAKSSARAPGEPESAKPANANEGVAPGTTTTTGTGSLDAPGRER